MRDKEEAMDLFLGCYPIKKIKPKGKGKEPEEIVDFEVEPGKCLKADNTFKALLLEVLLDIRDSILLATGQARVAGEGEGNGESDNEELSEDGESGA